MNKKTLMRHLGSMQQEAYIRPITWEEGRASRMKGFDLKNGKLSMKLMADKCLDVAELSYGGVNMSFLSKPGLQGRNQYDTNGTEALYSIMCGFFFTSGTGNICAPCTVDGVDYPMHGRMRTTPAEHLSSDARWDGDDYILKVEGEMREASLFGPNISLRRSFTTKLGSKTFTVTDVIENESFRDETMMLLYHINMGYPFLDENTRFYFPSLEVRARDKEAEGHEKDCGIMDAPKDNEPEYVFLHTLDQDAQGDTEIIVANEPLGLGLSLRFNRKNLPYFMEWKSTASGDYAVGLEPSNSSVYGMPYHLEKGDLHKMKPFAKETNVLTFTILDGAEELADAIRNRMNRTQE